MKFSKFLFTISKLGHRHLPWQAKEGAWSMGVTVGALPWANAVNQASWQRCVSQTSVSSAACWATLLSAGHLESFLSGWAPHPRTG